MGRWPLLRHSLLIFIQMPPRRTDTRMNKRKANFQEKDQLFSPSSHSRELGSAKPCTHDGSKQPTAPASGQDAVCCATQRKVRLTRGPCSPGIVQCKYSDCAEPSMTRTSPWSSVIEEVTLSDTRRTLNSTGFPKLKLTMSLGESCGPNKYSLSLCQRTHDLEPS